MTKQKKTSSKKEKLRIIIEETETTSGKLFNLAIQFLVLCSVISFSLETLPNLHPSMIVILNRVEVFIILIFSVEYLARIWVSKNSLKYVFSFYGIIDLLSILPFYLALAVDLRILRIFRFLRLFRILKIAKFIRAIDRFYEALKIAKEEIFLFLFATALVIYLSAAGIYFFENKVQPEKFSSIFSSLWWAVATLTTVGYGDVYPITVGGKIFTFVILMVGLGIVGIPAGLISSSLSAVRRKEEKKETK